MPMRCTNQGKVWLMGWTGRPSRRIETLIAFPGHWLETHILGLGALKIQITAPGAGAFGLSRCKESCPCL